MKAIEVYGTEWCGDCKRAKKVLDERKVTYNWTDIDKDHNLMEYVKELNNGKSIVPTIVFPDGSILVEPSNVQLIEKLELQTLS